MEIFFGLASAFWIGVLTSISPCPLTTNIVAISFISKKIENKRDIFITGLLYTLGRMLVYMALSLVVIKSIYAVPKLSYFLQNYINEILGPLLIVVGMFMLELITINIPSIGSSSKLQKIFSVNMGMWGALPLGALFALSFCPVSAALFFGSLIPLATKFSSPILLPSMYGIGTGVPVFIFSIFIAFGVSWMGNAFNKVGKFELWFRKLAGVSFIGIGIYLCLLYIFRVV